MFNKYIGLQRFMHWLFAILCINKGKNQNNVAENPLRVNLYNEPLINWSSWDANYNYAIMKYFHEQEIHQNGENIWGHFFPFFRTPNFALIKDQMAWLPGPNLCSIILPTSTPHLYRENTIIGFLDLDATIFNFFTEFKFICIYSF